MTPSDGIQRSAEALLDTLMLSVLDRRSEIGVLRAIAVTRRLTLNAVLAQAAAVRVVSGLRGLNRRRSWPKRDLDRIDECPNHRCGSTRAARDDPHWAGCTRLPPSGVRAAGCSRRPHQHCRGSDRRLIPR